MALVPAWDTRTGQKLPNDVPKSWLQNKTFPHLVGSAAAAAKIVEETATTAEGGEAAEAAVQTEAVQTTTTRKGR